MQESATSMCMWLVPRRREWISKVMCLPLKHVVSVLMSLIFCYFRLKCIRINLFKCSDCTNVWIYFVFLFLTGLQHGNEERQQQQQLWRLRVSGTSVQNLECLRWHLPGTDQRILLASLFFALTWSRGFSLWGYKSWQLTACNRIGTNPSGPLQTDPVRECCVECKSGFSSTKVAHSCYL